VSTPAELFLAGEACLAEGHFAQALQHYQHISDLGPQTYLLSHRIGYCLSKTDTHAQALLYLKQALQQNPSYHEIHHTLAEIYTYHLIDFEQAKTHWLRYLAAFPTQANAWDILAHVLYQRLEFAAALAAYERAFALQPDWPTLQRLLYTSLKTSPDLAMHRQRAEHHVNTYLKQADYPQYSHTQRAPDPARRLKIAYL